MDIRAVILTINLFFQYLVIAAVVSVIILMLVRLALNYADLNPFSAPVIHVRRMSDPLLNPVRRAILPLGVSPNVAPLIVVLLLILVGYFALEFIGTFLGTVGGVILSIQSGAPIALIGYLLLGLLATYSLLIFVRIIFSWGVSRSSRVMRFLIRATEPVLAPFRRLIPPVAMFDISPMIVLFLLQLLQKAVAGTMLVG